MAHVPARALLAALLVVAQMLAPFAHSHGRAASPGWINVCTGDGVRRLPAGDAPSAPLHDDDHCALCRIANPMAGVAPSIPAVVSLQAASADPVPATTGIAGGPPRHDAPARAPPAAV